MKKTVLLLGGVLLLSGCGGDAKISDEASGDLAPKVQQVREDLAAGDLADAEAKLTALTAEVTSLDAQDVNPERKAQILQAIAVLRQRIQASSVPAPTPVPSTPVVTPTQTPTSAPTPTKSVPVPTTITITPPTETRTITEAPPTPTVTVPPSTPPTTATPTTTAPTATPTLTTPAPTPSTPSVNPEPILAPTSLPAATN